MPVRPTLLALVTLTALLLAAQAWLAHYPASPLLAAVDLPGPSADVGTRCVQVRRQVTPTMALPLRDIRCARDRVGFAESPWHEDRQEVGMDLLTRRALWARRSWTPRDSLDWQAAQDSVRRAVRARGGVRLTCPTGPRGRGLEHIRVVEHWRVGRHTERLIAYRWDPSNSLNGEWRFRPWLLQVDAYAGDAPDCPRTSLPAA